MVYPELVYYEKELEYRRHFENVYCRGTIQTFDGINVRFRKDMFDHCFFESIITKDDTFSPRRAERIDWIKAALQDNTAKLHQGWDNKKKQPAKDRRVAIVVKSYVVIIRIRGNKAHFVTAFLASERTMRQINTNPIWK